MACIPGENFESKYSGQEIENILDKSAVIEALGNTLDGRVTGNETDISDLQSKQVADKSEITSNFHDIGNITTKIIDIDVDIANLQNQQTANTSDIVNNTNDITSTNTVVANILVDTAAESLKVSLLQTNYGLLDTRISVLETSAALIPSTYAPIAGDSSQVFEVADPITHTDAMNQRAADLRYITPAQVQVLIDTAIAAIP